MATSTATAWPTSPSSAPSTGDVVHALLLVRLRQSTATATQFGLDGDITVDRRLRRRHHTDYAVFRPSTGTWYHPPVLDRHAAHVGWGVPGDRPMPADYDGDGRTDIAVWRRPPASGGSSIPATARVAHAVGPVDGSADRAPTSTVTGRADLAVFRPSTAQWFLHLTTAAYWRTRSVRTWGQAGDIPVAADYDGDGRSRHRRSIVRRLGQWVGIDALTLGLVANVQWGLNGDTPRPHDFDGDGVADPVVFRPAVCDVVHPSCPSTGDAPTDSVGPPHRSAASSRQAAGQ